MLKYKVMAFFLFAAAVMSSRAYCQQEINGRPVSVVSGAVIGLDTAGGVITVQTADKMMAFYISIESDLTEAYHHIASIEILRGDAVMIQYAISSSGKNIIIKLVDAKPVKNPLLSI